MGPTLGTGHLGRHNQAWPDRWRSSCPKASRLGSGVRLGKGRGPLQRARRFSTPFPEGGVQDDRQNSDIKQCHPEHTPPANSRQALCVSDLTTALRRGDCPHIRNGGHWASDRLAERESIPGQCLQSPTPLPYGGAIRRPLGHVGVPAGLGSLSKENQEREARPAWPGPRPARPVSTRLVPAFVIMGL